MSVSDWVLIGVGIVLSASVLLASRRLLWFAHQVEEMAEATRGLAAEAEMQRLALREPWIQPQVGTFFSGWQVSLVNTGNGDAYDVQPLILLKRDAGYCEDAWAAGRHPDNEPEQRRGPRWAHIPARGSESWQLERLIGAQDFVATVLYRDRFGRQFVSGHAFRRESDEITLTGVVVPMLLGEPRVE